MTWQSDREQWNADGKCARVACKAAFGRRCMEHPTTKLLYCIKCGRFLEDSQGVTMKILSRAPLGERVAGLLDVNHLFTTPAPRVLACDGADWCDSRQKAWDESRVGLRGGPEPRTWILRVPPSYTGEAPTEDDLGYVPDFTSLVSFCPWCGTSLNKDTPRA